MLEGGGLASLCCLSCATNPMAVSYKLMATARRSCAASTMPGEEGERDMHAANRPMRPKDKSIDMRTRAFGVLGFLLLAGVFFSVGVFCVGPRLRPSHGTEPSGRLPSYTPTVPWRSAADDSDESAQPDLKVDVKERSLDEASGDETESVSEDQTDVRLEGDKLTIPLGTDDEPPDARDEPKDKPTTASPGPSLEVKRAATEKSGTLYRVQVGSYASKSNADTLVAKLKDGGYRRASVIQTQVGGRTLYRVQVGEYKTIEDAQELARDLGATGYEPAVVEVR